MRAEAINLFLHGFLETSHNKKGDDASPQSYGNSNNSNNINDGRKTFLLLPADSFCDEVREVQKDWLKFGLSTLKIKYKMVRISILLFLFCFQACLAQEKAKVILGIEQVDNYLPKLENKRVGLLVNQTSVIGDLHLADLLKSKKIDVKKIFSPEHGFRGEAAAGEHVNDSIDPKTGFPVVSLYGSNRKPTADQLKDVDVVIFDIQDVGTRFFTYISTLHYLMEACAENNKKVIVLDRPNPNAYVDGPVKHPETKMNFLGMHPIPVTHGMTVGEYARMINGEGWLAGGKKCELEVIETKFWKRGDFYSIKIKPSPNLPNDHAIALYPSVCFLEQTVISIGRGTQTPFEIIGNPLLKDLPYQFTPVDIKGMAIDPPHENQLCYGYDLRKDEEPEKVSLKYLIDMYKIYPDKENFFGKYFDNIAGNSELKDQIKQGMTEDQIRATWQKDLDAFKEKRKKYLIYQ